jgi:hypothetical protein
MFEAGWGILVPWGKMHRDLSALGLALALLGCSPSSPGVISPCREVTCSGHGTCSSNGQTASCTCEPGYRARGLVCELDTTGDASVSDAGTRDSGSTTVDSGVDAGVQVQQDAGYDASTEEDAGETSSQDAGG